MSPTFCPSCGNQLHPLKGPSPRASNFESCLRKCDPCGVGLSNRLTNPTIIYRNPLDNVPPEVRSGAIQALSSALNVGSRTKKLHCFGFNTSEDALTWTVFSHLQGSGQLAQSVGHLLPNITRSEPTMLLWGAPVPKESLRGQELGRTLMSSLKHLGENKNSFSEPDVLLDFGQEGLVLIEVKFRSGNDQKPPGSKASKYTIGSAAFRDERIALESNMYELVRNWRIGFDLAGERPMTLVNLVVSAKSNEEACMKNFCSGIAEDSSHRFVQIMWSDFFDRTAAPVWLQDYRRKLGI